MPSIFKLAVDCLTFLKDIHQHKIIHNDIKANNILLDTDTGTFVVIDYEMMMHVTDKINSIMLHDIKEDTTLYLMKGTRLNEPVYGYKSDLIHVGYMLIDLVIRSISTSTLCEHMIPLVSDGETGIIEHRDAVINKFLDHKDNSKIKKYMSLVSQYINTVNPMNGEYYDKLIQQFSI